MKTPIQAKSGHHVNGSSVPRNPVPRAHATRAIEHRSERRKIREQLRRLDWALSGEGEIFA